MEFQQFAPCLYIYPPQIKGKVLVTTLIRSGAKLYNGGYTVTIEQRRIDREIAEKILRAYYEDGIVPTGLTEEFVYGSWSESDYVLRNTWDFGSSTRTWRYQG